MKFNIFNFNQKKACEIGLDLKDLLILEWFQTFQPRMHKTIRDNKQYYWIQYEELISDIPIIEITTSKGLYKRLQNLCEIGMLEYLPIRTGNGCFSYYLITEKIIELISCHSSQSSSGSSQSSSGSSQSSSGSSQSSDAIYNNSLTINPITINQQKNIKKEKPTLEEITKYIEEEKLNLNPQNIFNYYEKNNWIKKNGKPVLNWKSTLKTIANTKTIAEKQINLNEVSFDIVEKKKKSSDYEKIRTLYEYKDKLSGFLKNNDASEIKDFCYKIIKNNITKATIQDIQNNYEAQELLKQAYLKYLQQIKTNKQEIDIAIKEELGLFLSKCLEYKYIAVIESLNTFKKENYNDYRIKKQEKNLTFLSLKDFILNDIKSKSEMIDFYNDYMFKEIEKLLG